MNFYSPGGVAEPPRAPSKVGRPGEREGLVWKLHTQRSSSELGKELVAGYLLNAHGVALQQGLLKGAPRRTMPRRRHRCQVFGLVLREKPQAAAIHNVL